MQISNVLLVNDDTSCLFALERLALASADRHKSGFALLFSTSMLNLLCCEQFRGDQFSTHLQAGPMLALLQARAPAPSTTTSRAKPATTHPTTRGPHR